jgi:hypothetical protein
VIIRYQIRKCPAQADDTGISPMESSAMADRELRDARNALLGKIRTRPDGKLELRDQSNRFLGTYDPKFDQTRDATNKLIGKGNLLTTLLL